MKVFLKSFGCSTNIADGEVLSGCLVAAGHDLVDSLAAANIVIYNTCAVKGPTEDRIINLLKIQEHQPPLEVRQPTLQVQLVSESLHPGASRPWLSR